MVSDSHGYNKGFAAGYRAGLADGLAGKQPGDGVEGLLVLPLEFLELSVRARNCLAGQGCQNIKDVAGLSEDTIRRMRNLGKVSANEIAHALLARDIRHTAWECFLQD